MEGVGTIDKVLAHAVGVAARASTEAEILCSIRVEKGLLHLLLYLQASQQRSTPPSSISVQSLHPSATLPLFLCLFKLGQQFSLKLEQQMRKFRVAAA